MAAADAYTWVLFPLPVALLEPQVHKAQLRRFRRDQLRSLSRRERGLMAELAVGPGDSAWSICNSHGVSLAELAAANKQLELDDLQVR
jgi:hypothetical protein